MKIEPVQLLITGGTIDDLEYHSDGQVPQDRQSLMLGLLEQARVIAKGDVEVLMLKDSKFINTEDRTLMLKWCRECPEKRIIITHGTMTMAATAAFLAEAKLSKTIVLTGAAVAANQKGSDAFFNLGSAFVAVGIMPPGVYVAMHGHVFKGEKVRKNPISGFFEEIPSKEEY